MSNLPEGYNEDGQFTGLAEDYSPNNVDDWNDRLEDQ